VNDQRERKLDRAKKKWKSGRMLTLDELRELAVDHSTQTAFADGNGKIEMNMRKLNRLLREGER